MKKGIILIVFLNMLMGSYSQNESRPIAPALDITFIGACFQRNDTILCCHIDKKTDSIEIVSVGIKVSRQKWRFQDENGSFSISKYKRVKDSDWFKKNNTKFLNADFECKQRGIEKVYDKEDNLNIVVYHVFKGKYVKQIKRK